MNTKSNILIALAIIAVGSVSFISGRLSVEEKKGIDMGQAGAVNAEKGITTTAGASNSGAAADSGQASIKVTGATTTPATGAFIASKAGEKYFPVSCSSAKTIKKENAIYFDTAEEAELTGRTQSSRCKY